MPDLHAKSYLHSKPDAWLDHPFGPDVEVYKIRGKMFATLGYEGDVARINLKCDPEEAMALRDIFASVIPGYHMNKAHWNTVILDGSIPRGEIERMIDRSYALVVRGLKRRNEPPWRCVMVAHPFTGNAPTHNARTHEHSKKTTTWWVVSTWRSSRITNRQSWASGSVYLSGAGVTLRNPTRRSSPMPSPS